MTLEAYFHNDPRIEEWVNQITEKIFTVCLLNGVDSEAEFQRGCQIVAKVTNLLQGISIFPSEYLEDGLKQLLQQQLPDSRVINNFPAFQDTMNKMLSEGMTRAIDTRNDENLEPLDSFIKNTPENTKEDTEEIHTVHCAENIGRPMALNDEIVTEPALTALASVNSMTILVPSIPTKPYKIIRKTQVPEQSDRLKTVLSNIFPNASVCWSLSLMGQTFLAQVEDILIYLHNPEQPCPVENLNKEGWKVYECSANDLMFPRRLERGIRQIQRLGKRDENP